MYASDLQEKLSKTNPSTL